MKESADRFVRLDPQGRDVEGVYLYISAPRTGTNADSPYVDMLLLNGHPMNGPSDAYRSGKNFYRRVNKQYLADLAD